VVLIGEAILWGLLVAIPGVFAATLYIISMKTMVLPK